MAVLTDRSAVLLACREEQLDSLLALRRIAAHLGDLPRLGPADTQRPGAALVCDDEATTARLTRLGVPVLHLSSTPPEPTATTPASTPTSPSPSPSPSASARPPDTLISRAHWPGWLDRPPGVRPTGLLAPVRLARNRDRRGTLVLLSLWNVPDREAEAFTARRLPALIREALRYTGSCTVICDTALDLVRAAAAGLPVTAVARAADTDVDARHSDAELLLASPTLTALALARARRAPLAFLPPLGPAQCGLAERVARLVPVPTAAAAHPVTPAGRVARTRPAGPTDPALWQPPPAEVQWAALGPELDDLRGAQALARTVRQLLLAPL